MIPFTFEKNGRKYMRLERGDLLRSTDWQWTKDGTMDTIIPDCFFAGNELCGERVEIGKLENCGNHFYRDITKPKKQTKKANKNGNTSSAK